MKTLIVYSSQTGFTKRYAEWLAERMKAQCLPLKEAETKDEAYFSDFDSIVYGGWALGGSIVDVKWFQQQAENWKEKKLAIFCVGASPIDEETTPLIEEMKEKVLTPKLKGHAKFFYCPGGFNYEKMPFASKMAMGVFTAMHKLFKNKTADDKLKIEMLSKSYDIYDPCYLDPIVEFLEA